MMPPEIQARIDQLYADMKPLMDLYHMQPQTIQQRYQRIQQQKQVMSALKLRPSLRWKL